jgi:cytochrome c oxidase cbb3-type subunit 3
MVTMERTTPVCAPIPAAVYFLFVCRASDEKRTVALQVRCEQSFLSIEPLPCMWKDREAAIGRHIEGRLESVGRRRMRIVKIELFFTMANETRMNHSRFTDIPIRSFTASVLCLCFGFFLILPAAADVTKNPMTEPNVRRGSAQFQQSCSICHGSGAIGGTGPSLLESTLVRHDVNGNLIDRVVRQGRPNKGMPPFPDFSAAQILDIAAFLHARIEVTSGANDTGPVGGYSPQQLLTGNVEAGKQYFNGGGKCATCHSPSGDLAGIASKYAPAELESRFLYPPTDDITATVSLPSGQKVKGKLVHLDAFYVAILNEDGWYRSWPLQGVKVKVTDPLAGHLELLHEYTDKDIHNVFSYIETLK